MSERENPTQKFGYLGVKSPRLLHMSERDFARQNILLVTWARVRYVYCIYLSGISLNKILTWVSVRLEHVKTKDLLGIRSGKVL